jgi:hypothetical protein
VDHWNFGLPWTDLHCRPEDLLRAWPTAALGLEAVGQGQGRGWRTGNSMSRSPELRRQRGDRKMEKGGGDQNLMVGARSGVRGKARRKVWGEAS